MHARYEDILGEMTRALRNSHAETKDHGEGPAPECGNQIDEETGLCTCVPVPLWWDENGVPRFGTHHPRLCPNIYAEEVALLLIRCQACEHEFRVQMARDSMSLVRQLMQQQAGIADKIPTLSLEDLRAEYEALNMDLITVGSGPTKRFRTLADEVRDGSIHYGDPPNIDCCPAGPTMNCDDLAVLEFWDRTDPDFVWARRSDLEIKLPTSVESS